VGPLDEVDLVEVAVDAGADLDGGDGFGPAGEVLVIGDGVADGCCDLDLRCLRRGGGPGRSPAVPARPGGGEAPGGGQPATADGAEQQEKGQPATAKEPVHGCLPNWLLPRAAWRRGTRSGCGMSSVAGRP